MEINLMLITFFGIITFIIKELLLNSFSLNL